MRSADKVSKMYTLNRAYVVAYTASGALIVINDRQVILNLDGAVRTGFLTLSASDTAVQTHLTHLSALIVAGALDHDP